MISYKARTHEAITDLDAETYILLSASKTKTPPRDNGVKEIKARIRDLEAQLGLLEVKSNEVSQKPPQSGREKRRVRNETKK